MKVGQLCGYCDHYSCSVCELKNLPIDLELDQIAQTERMVVKIFPCIHVSEYERRKKEREDGSNS